MQNLKESIFSELFRDACSRCFGSVPEGPLSDADSKVLSNDIFESTGLVIGAKSLKNYSHYLSKGGEAKRENPSTATLDTLARYILKAPVTSEAERKKTENHFPYWFRYKKEHSSSPARNKPFGTGQAWRLFYGMTAAIVTLILLAWLLFKPGKEAENFTEFFRSLQEDSLRSRGWLLKSTKRSFWSRRNEQPGALTLFTIPGDNWPDSVHQPLIHNLLLRIVSNQCFTAELHFSNFVPLRNWQQAGILLLEDSSLSSKSLRLSIAYNDYSGGLSRIPSILVQAIISPGGHSLKPEEIVHHELFNPDRDSSEVIRLNLSHSALRVEKKGNQIRLLFSDGAFANSAFKELFSGEFNFEPAYVGIFALKGFTGNDGIMPVRISYFSLNSENCTP